MKNSFCYLSAHGFLRVSQGQMPGAGMGLTIWRVFPLPPWGSLVPMAVALVVCFSGRCLPGLPPAAGQRPLPLGVHLRCGPRSLSGLLHPHCPPIIPSSKPSSLVPAYLPARPPPPPPSSTSFFLTCISNYFSLSLYCLPYLKLTSPLPLPVQGSLLKVLETFTR